MTGRPMPETLPGMKKILVVPLLAALVLTLFAWPAAKIGPRDLPVGVVGTEQLPPQFETHRFTSEAEARAAIEDREVYGALAGEKVLVASAASPAVAQFLTHAAGERPVEDVVAAKPESNALAASVLPLVLAGILTGALAAHLTRRRRRRAGLVFGGALLSGLSATLIVQTWLGVVGGDWFANAAALSLTVLAIGTLVAGLEALFGKAGIAAGALTMVFIGNPFSGVATGPEMLPTPAGTIGQLLPPGAGGNLLRSTGYFEGAAAGGHILVLTLWTLAGLACLALARTRIHAA